MVKKLKIVHIIYGLKMAGAEKTLVHLAVMPDRSLYESSVVTLNMRGPLEDVLRAAGVPVHYLKKRGRYDLSLLYRLTRFLIRKRPDVVHTHLYGGDIWGRTAAMLARVPFIVSSLQAEDVWLKPSQLFLERMTALFTHRLLAVSEGVKNFYMARVGVPVRKISVVHNAIDCAHYPARCDRGEKRRELGVAVESPLVCTASRLEEQKDLFTWLRAARLLLDRVPEAEFIIAGEGSQRRRLQDYSGKLGISEKVHFLGRRRDIDELFAVCDLVIFSSRFEGLSLAMLEAMASRRAVIATSIGGNVELIEHGRSGILVPVGDEAALARAAERLLSDERERRRMGEAARRTVEEKFCVEKMLEDILKVYREGHAGRVKRTSKEPNNKS